MNAAEQVVTTTPSNTLFDPCADIPAEAIEQVGFDPSTQELREFGDDAHFICVYKGAERGQFLNIHAARDPFEHKLAVKEQLSDISNITPIEIDGRIASQEQDKVLTDSCDVMVKVPFGIFIIQQSVARAERHTDPAVVCGTARQTAEVLLQYVPRGSG